MVSIRPSSGSTGALVMIPILFWLAVAPHIFFSAMPEYWNGLPKYFVISLGTGIGIIVMAVIVKRGEAVSIPPWWVLGAFGLTLVLELLSSLAGDTPGTSIFGNTPIQGFLSKMIIFLVFMIALQLPARNMRSVFLILIFSVIFGSLFSIYQGSVKDNSVWSGLGPFHATFLLLGFWLLFEKFLTENKRMLAWFLFGMLGLALFAIAIGLDGLVLSAFIFSAITFSVLMKPVNNKKLAIILLTAVVFIAVALISVNRNYLQFRQAFTQNATGNANAARLTAARMINERPITGFGTDGFNTRSTLFASKRLVDSAFEERYRLFNVPGVFLALAVNGGLVSLTAFLWIVFSISWILLKKAKKGISEGAALAAGLSVYLFTSQFQADLIYVHSSAAVLLSLLLVKEGLFKRINLKRGYAIPSFAFSLVFLGLIFVTSYAWLNEQKSLYGHEEKLTAAKKAINYMPFSAKYRANLISLSIRNADKQSIARTVKVARASVIEFPNDPEIRTLLAKALSIKNGLNENREDTKEFCRQSKKALSLFPNNPEAGDLYNACQHTLEKQKDLKAALSKSASRKGK